MLHVNRGLKLVLAVAGLAGSAAMSTAAQAQANPISFGVAAGASKATGDFGDVVDLGYHFGGLVQWNGPDLPIGFRGEVVYHRFSLKENLQNDAGLSDANASIVAGTVNGVYSFPTEKGAPMIPYLIAGAGLYHIKGSASCSDCGGVSVSDTQNKFGLNGGGGVSFPLTGFSAFIEARFHHIFTDGGGDNMVPVSVGIVFHP
jgi:opacity protein-like surface antigen